jgi:glyceraldehyde 3-phosphate dehydrogenase
MAVRVAINGFGRIGRHVVKAIRHRYWADLEIVAIGVTDPYITDVRALLLKHDSIQWPFEAEVEAVVRGRTNAIRVDDRQIDIVGRNPYGPVPEWRRWAVDLVLEATGYAKDRDTAGKHLLAGAGRVIVTAPVKQADLTVVLGVNEASFDPARHLIVSNASCTTNCLAPTAKVIYDTYGIQYGLLSTIHSYTSSQELMDHAGKDPRRSRAAALNIVPTSTGAAKAVGAVIPALAGRFHGSALRVPTPSVSLADFTALVDRPPGSADEVNAVLRQAAEGPMRGVLAVVEVPLVSIDFIGDPHSSIVDAPATMIEGDLVRTVLWYDNEWGYANRVADLAYYVSQRALGLSHDEVRAAMWPRLAPTGQAAGVAS